jgi:amino acid permease
VNDHRSGRHQFNLSGLLGFVAFCIILGFLISLHSRDVDRISAFIFLGLRVVLGIVFGWMIWSSRHRGGGRARPLPYWYRKWFLGEENPPRK